ncbi:MAG: hypothetical protein ACI4EB_00535, partial [Bilifractor sp.]
VLDSHAFLVIRVIQYTGFHKKCKRSAPWQWGGIPARGKIRVLIGPADSVKLNAMNTAGRNPAGWAAAKGEKEDG